MRVIGQVGTPGGPLTGVQRFLIKGYSCLRRMHFLTRCEEDLQRVEMLDLKLDTIISNRKFNGQQRV